MSDLKRNFPNFVDSFFDYAKDGYCPDDYHLWTGISLVSAALERKVWINYQGKVMYYPNLFVFLSGPPGLGKSTALNRGHELLRRLPDFNILPQQLTEAKLINLMSEGGKSFELMKKGKSHIFRHTSGLFLASEAKNSIKEVKGSLPSIFTDFYDCPNVWSKGTIGRDVEKLEGVCLSILAGCTMTFLGELIGGSNIMDGFASRIIYVIAPQNWTRHSQWAVKDNIKIDYSYGDKLFEDLQQIYEMGGEFKAKDCFIKKYNDWFAEFEVKRAKQESEVMQALMVRQQTNILKLCQVFSAAEGNDLILTGKHWDRAQGMIDATENALPELIMSVQAQGNKEDQGNINQIVMRIIQKNGSECQVSHVKKIGILQYKIEPARIEATIAALSADGKCLERTVEGRNDRVKLLIDPNNYL